MPTHSYVIVQKRIWKFEIFLKFDFFRYWYFLGTCEYHIWNQHKKLNLLSIMNRGEPRFDHVVHFWTTANHNKSTRFAYQKMHLNVSICPLCLFIHLTHAIVSNHSFSKIFQIDFCNPSGRNFLTGSSLKESSEVTLSILGEAKLI